MRKNGRTRDFCILYFAFLVYSFVSVFAKIASKQNSVFEMLVYIGIEFCLLVFYAIIWQQVLKKFQLVVAISNKGVTVVFSLIWSVIFFHEHITIQNIAGSIMIILGIWLVTVDG